MTAKAKLHVQEDRTFVLASMMESSFDKTFESVAMEQLRSRAKTKTFEPTTEEEHEITVSRTKQEEPLMIQESENEHEVSGVSEGQISC